PSPLQQLLRNRPKLLQVFRNNLNILLLSFRLLSLPTGYLYFTTANSGKVLQLSHLVRLALDLFSTTLGAEKGGLLIPSRQWLWQSADGGGGAVRGCSIIRGGEVVASV